MNRLLIFLFLSVPLIAHASDFPPPAPRPGDDGAESSSGEDGLPPPAPSVNIDDVPDSRGMLSNLEICLMILNFCLQECEPSYDYEKGKVYKNAERAKRCYEQFEECVNR